MVPAALAISGGVSTCLCPPSRLPGQPLCTGVRQKNDPHLCDGRTIRCHG